MRMPGRAGWLAVCAVLPMAAAGWSWPGGL